jgi:hypothetical protein
MLQKPIFGCRNISLRLKYRLYACLVRSVLLYGLKTLALTASDQTMIEVFDKSCIRRFCRGWRRMTVNGRLVRTCISDSQLHERTQLPMIGDEITIAVCWALYAKN